MMNTIPHYDLVVIGGGINGTGIAADAAGRGLAVALFEADDLASAIACFITIIGIPFGIQHLKLAGLALAPIGQTVVSKEVAEAAIRAEAEATVAGKRS